MDAVRVADRDRYLAALYAPEDKRPALLALYAFNAEIAAIRDRVSEPMPGEIRLQWWRDIIASGTKQLGAGHPLATALMTAIETYRLPAAAFDNYLEARIFDLYDDPMPSRTDLEGYCGETASAMIQLAALILDAPEAPRHAELSGHAGCAQAISGLLRLLPKHRARGQCYVPKDILAAAGLTPEEFVAGGHDPRAAVAVQAMIALAREHLRAFERGAKALPATLRPAFLPLSLTPAYLDRVERGKDGMSTLRKHFTILATASRGWR
ncbi:phytoene/squalene synthase family protein [Aminobacter carboxidus]|uniref:Phytoene/squalene synthase family protein n=1 Tax=Aminobacter carboxidus TaxID=376165 RepID=A0ABR9GJI3_9HYPH|nr:phytoene/squalene synthase family protein [Aminobacter carboxidus]MBE1203790.1 phytoene/squalene synthase family protein [Aminobacter carboxidus]